MSSNYILLVEDNPDDVAFLRAALRRQKADDVELSHASTIAEADIPGRWPSRSGVTPSTRARATRGRNGSSCASWSSRSATTISAST